MTVRVGMLKSGMTAEDHRHALGVHALGTGQAMRTRSGLVPGSNPTYTKVSGMTARVTPFQAWIAGTSQSLQGGYPFTTDADENVTFADGDATRARIDLVVARVYDSLYDASGQQLGRVMVVQGDYPVSGPAVAPAAPPNSIVLWEQPVPAGTTAGSGGINVGQAVRRWEYTAAAGGVVPVRNQAERDAMQAYDGLVVARLDTGNLERRHQGAWGPVSDHARGAQSNWYTEITANTTINVGTAVTNVPGLSLTVTTVAGRRYRVRFDGMVYSTVAGDTAGCYIREGATTRGGKQVYVGTADRGYDAAAVAYLVPGAGTRTFTAALARANGTGLLNIQAASITPASLTVEDIGPA